jgi:hypothetical protein
MVDRVAEAVNRVNRSGDADYYRTVARAAITAMREPLLNDVRTLHGFAEPFNDATEAVCDRIGARLAEIDEALAE